jgi:hypothetical protein
MMKSSCYKVLLIKFPFRLVNLRLTVSPGFSSSTSQLPALETAQTMSPIIPMTRSAPTQTPALKMSPITSQPVKAMAEKTKITNKNRDCFIGVLRIRFVA